jgi:hypothetical protein
MVLEANYYKECNFRNCLNKELQKVKVLMVLKVLEANSSLGKGSNFCIDHNRLVEDNKVENKWDQKFYKEGN